MTYIFVVKIFDSIQALNDLSLSPCSSGLLINEIYTGRDLLDSNSLFNSACATFSRKDLPTPLLPTNMYGILPFQQLTICLSFSVSTNMLRMSARGISSVRIKISSIVYRPWLLINSLTSAICPIFSQNIGAISS